VTNFFTLQGCGYFEKVSLQMKQLGVPLPEDADPPDKAAESKKD
jgi:hypothetical protein